AMNASAYSGLFLLVLLAPLPACGKELHAAIVYDDAATDIPVAREDAGQLWISTGDLKRATRFEVKPQGVCRDELCFPLPKGRQQEFVRKTPPVFWVNMTAFAGLVRHPAPHDPALSTWYFGLRADQRQLLS